MQSVLVIGSGAREHCLSAKLAQSAKVAKVYVAPGNGGTATDASGKIENVALQAGDFAKLIDFAKSKNIAFTIVGPEQPLVDGISDAFHAAGLKIFGPTRQAAQLEGSKAFSKDFMKKYNIPTAEYASFTDYNAAAEYIRTAPFNVVVKASGLAAGKGVVVPESKDEALAALKEMMVDKIHGAAGSEVVLEERLTGPEASVFVICDGSAASSSAADALASVVVMPAAQDHKRAFDNDQGPNTGGMGAYCPAPVVTPALSQTILSTIVAPTVSGLFQEKLKYVGLIFIGVMLTPSGPKVLEYNCRPGDPETQVVFSLLENDLFDVIAAAVSGSLRSLSVTFKPLHACTVVAASGGYPGSFKKGYVISGLKEAAALPGVVVYHGGTAQQGSNTVSSGGRVLSATGVADTLKGAVDAAYAALSEISFTDMMYRKDIARRALPVSYADAGVNISEGDRFVDEISSIVKSTARAGSDAEIGGFGGLFDLKACGFKDPILVSGTDGVGTKLLIAHTTEQHHTIGIDLVAMCVNDVLVQGAEPLFFLDYFATGKLAVGTAKQVLVGIADGCRQAGCALVGGETAEMPGMYHPGTYDLAGFSVGAVEREKMLPRLTEFSDEDVVLGLPSSGVHSNGYSLVRHLVSRLGLEYTSPPPFPSQHSTLGQALLEPTRIYVRALLPLIRKNLILGMAHITGGGLIENIPRTLPENVGVELDAATWPLVPVIKWLKESGNMTVTETATTFNCGLGMVMIVSKAHAAEVQQLLQQAGEKVYVVGKTVKLNSGHKRNADGHAERVKITNTHLW